MKDMKIGAEELAAEIKESLRLWSLGQGDFSEGGREAPIMATERRPNLDRTAFLIACEAQS